MRLLRFPPQRIRTHGGHRHGGLDIYDGIWKVLLRKVPTDTFIPPRIVGELASQGKLGLKSGEGFYKYEGDMLGKVQRERDKKLFDRLALYKKESGKE